MNNRRWLVLAMLMLAGCGTSETRGTDTAAPGTGTGTRTGTGIGTGTTVTVQTTPGTFVWLEPVSALEFPPAEGAAYMDQQGQMFIPDTLLARTGQPVHFRSSEDVLHNVRVVRNDKKPIFNVATPPFGSYIHTFDEPGFYNVTCDIHTAMRATIYVASTPYVATSDEHGRFTFQHVIPGTYKVSGFADGRPIEKTIDVAGERVDLKLVD